MAVLTIATKPDGEDGAWTLDWHEEGTAELRHRPAGRPLRCLVGRQMLYRIQAEMGTLALTEDCCAPA